MISHRMVRVPDGDTWWNMETRVRHGAASPENAADFFHGIRGTANFWRNTCRCSHETPGKVGSSSWWGRWPTRHGDFDNHACNFGWIVVQHLEYSCDQKKAHGREKVAMFGWIFSWTWPFEPLKYRTVIHCWLERIGNEKLGCHFFRPRFREVFVVPFFFQNETTPGRASDGSKGSRGLVSGFHQGKWRHKAVTLWLFNSLPWYRWPIEIDGLPGDFPWLRQITRW